MLYRRKKEKGCGYINSIFHICLWLFEMTITEAQELTELIRNSFFSIHTPDSPSWKVGLPCQQDKMRDCEGAHVCVYTHIHIQVYQRKNKTG